MTRHHLSANMSGYQRQRFITFSGDCYNSDFIAASPLYKKK
jgi:hypothetical protein